MLKISTALTALLLAACATMPTSATDRGDYWNQRVTLFDQLPVGEEDIVFLGNSITDGGEFAELLCRPRVLNRGISADVIDGVEERLAQVTNGHPAKIFLLIGINDISHALSLKQLTERYERLVKRIRQESPQTRLYLQSVMPIDNSFARYKNLLGRENMIEPLNEQIRRIAAEQQCQYIDLWPALADPETGKLRSDYTNDGLHLTGPGYRAWADAVKKYVEE